MHGYEMIRVSRADGVETIVLDRPERRNALNPVLIAELIRAFEHADATDAGVVILTGAGSAFCAGLDLEHLQTMHQRTAAEHRADSEQIARLFRTLYDMETPTIAAVNGPAIAGGTGLATICDFTLAVPQAKFGYTEVRIGFVPAIVSSFLLRQLGEKKARELLLTGRVIGAEEALGLGLVTRIVEEAQLTAEATALAHELLRNSPEALRAVKRLLRGYAGQQLDEEITAALELNARARETADFREGIASFLEKRKPQWRKASQS
jgi:methylglutaconyl-CoA hydratase